MNLIVAQTREQIEFCKDVLFDFRPVLDKTTYLDLTMAMIKDESFSLVYIPNADNTQAAGFVGYRIQHTLRTGWMIYVDDLYTDPGSRGKGYAGALLDYVFSVAAEAQIRSVSLDSGYMLHDAHRLYLNKGFVLGCNHFVKQIALQGD